MNIEIGTEALDELENAIRKAVGEALEDGRITQEAASDALNDTEMDSHKLFFHDKVEYALREYVKEIVDDLEVSYE